MGGRDRGTEGEEEAGRGGGRKGGGGGEEGGEGEYGRFLRRRSGRLKRIRGSGKKKRS